MTGEKEVKEYRVWNSTLVRRTPLKRSTKPIKRTAIKRVISLLNASRRPLRSLKACIGACLRTTFLGA